MTRTRLGPLMAGLSLLAMAVAGYLTWVKLSGTAPMCAVLSGCETVENSRYSEFLGIPVAVFGLAGAGAFAWKGQMMDMPHLTRAKKIAERARQAGVI